MKTSHTKSTPNKNWQNNKVKTLNFQVKIRITQQMKFCLPRAVLCLWHLTWESSWQTNPEKQNDWVNGLHVSMFIPVTILWLFLGLNVVCIFSFCHSFSFFISFCCSFVPQSNNRITFHSKKIQNQIKFNQWKITTRYHTQLINCLEINNHSRNKSFVTIIFQWFHSQLDRRGCECCPRIDSEGAVCELICLSCSWICVHMPLISLQQKNWCDCDSDFKLVFQSKQQCHQSFFCFCVFCDSGCWRDTNLPT